MARVSGPHDNEAAGAETKAVRENPESSVLELKEMLEQSAAAYSLGESKEAQETIARTKKLAQIIAPIVDPVLSEGRTHEQYIHSIVECGTVMGMILFAVALRMPEPSRDATMEALCKSARAYVAESMERMRIAHAGH